MVGSRGKDAISRQHLSDRESHMVVSLLLWGGWCSEPSALLMAGALPIHHGIVKNPLRRSFVPVRTAPGSGFRSFWFIALRVVHCGRSSIGSPLRMAPLGGIANQDDLDHGLIGLSNCGWLGPDGTTREPLFVRFWVAVTLGSLKWRMDRPLGWGKHEPLSAPRMICIGPGNNLSDLQRARHIRGRSSAFGDQPLGYIEEFNAGAPSELHPQFKPTRLSFRRIARVRFDRHGSSYQTSTKCRAKIVWRATFSRGTSPLRRRSGSSDECAMSIKSTTDGDLGPVTSTKRPSA
jgi:hypothetical protein